MFWSSIFLMNSMKTYRFVRSGTDWYIDLPEYLEQGGSQGDLQMVEGADKMLDMMAEKENVVVLKIERESFEGADVLELKERCDPYVGGGYYFMSRYEGQEVARMMWLCGVTEFVFGDLPEQIFVKKVKT